MDELESHIYLEGWPRHDADAVAYDLVCRLCDGRSRLHPGDAFVAQVLVFLEQHLHEEP